MKRIILITGYMMEKNKLDKLEKIGKMLMEKFEAVSCEYYDYFPPELQQDDILIILEPRDYIFYHSLNRSGLKYFHVKWKIYNKKEYIHFDDKGQIQILM